MELLKYLGLRWYLAITLAPMACKAPPASTEFDVNLYEEDISRYRTEMVDTMNEALTDLRQQAIDRGNDPQVQAIVPVSMDNTEAINLLLDSLSGYNARIPYVDGFTILVYSGISRDEVTLAQRRVQEMGLQPRFEYSRPNFKIKVGRFTNELDARRTHLFLKQYFRSAIVVPERISINE